jgi:predicted phage tail protein
MKKVALRASVMMFALAGLLLFSACASAPKEEIAATQTAVTAVQTDEVRTYAPDSLKDAESTLEKAMAEVQTQDNKFAMSRDYKAASDLLKEAKDKAAKATADATANKTKVKADAEATIAALGAEIDAAKKALASAPRGKDTKADLEAMQADLKTAEESEAAATQAMTAEKYMDALANANAAKDKANGIISQVEAAKAKIKGRR